MSWKRSQKGRGHEVRSRSSRRSFRAFQAPRCGRRSRRPARTHQDMVFKALDAFRIELHEIALFECQTGRQADIAYMVDQSHNLKGKIARERGERNAVAGGSYA